MNFETASGRISWMEAAVLTRTWLRVFKEQAAATLQEGSLRLCSRACTSRRRSKGVRAYERNLSAVCAPAGIQPQQQLFASRMNRYFCHTNAFNVALSSVKGSRYYSTEPLQSTLASVVPMFSVMKFDEAGNVSSFERKKTELFQELGLQARDLRFQHLTSINAKNNCIILRMEILKAVITPKYLLILDYRQPNLECWLLNELASQLAGDGQLVMYSLPFEFRAIEAILQHRMNTLQARLNEIHPQVLETLDALVDPKLLSLDRSKLHVLLQNSKNLSELETDVKVFKEALLKILDEEKLIEELCVTKWSETQVFEKSSKGIDPAEEMELLLENYYRQAEDLANTARELKVLINDSESIIFINLDSHRNVMMRLNLQLTMGTFSVSLFGIVGVAFGMNLESSFEEDPRIFWLVTGIMFLGSGLMWRRLLSFLGRHLDPPPPMLSIPKRPQPSGGTNDLGH
ncbi:magnesium transporter MRS2 homolog, mitochondrial [Callorhinchus milii]|nr:magnesium transporter MRS2 homolog, mitochondrial [Callorhinchus milii]